MGAPLCNKDPLVTINKSHIDLLNITSNSQYVIITINQRTELEIRIIIVMKISIKLISLYAKKVEGEYFDATRKLSKL